MGQGDTLDRFPPSSREAEMGVLGCLLLQPRESMTALNAMGMHSGMFYDLRHRSIFEMIDAMLDIKIPIDLITLQQQLKNRDMLDGIGGIAYLSSLQDSVPSAANLPWYFETLREKFALRQVVVAATEITSTAYKFSGEIGEFLNECEKRIMDVGRSCVNQTREDKTAKELAIEGINAIERMHQSQGAVLGIASGFRDVDKMTLGFQNGDLIVIAGRPSMGKTSWMMNAAEHVAIDLHQPVGIFSFEMSPESLMLRILSSRARVNLRNVQRGFMSQQDVQTLTNASGTISRSPLHIIDARGYTTNKMKSKARQMVAEHGIKLFGIDYLQLITSSRRTDKRNDEITYISSSIKAIAGEHNVPVIAASQLSRDLEKGHAKPRRPRLSDLRDGGAIEQDADVVGLLTSATGESIDDSGLQADSVGIDLIIAKQRNGPTGVVPMTFLKTITRFESAATIEKSDYQ